MIIKSRPLEVTFLLVKKTFDAKTENIGNFVLVVKNSNEWFHVNSVCTVNIRSFQLIVNYYLKQGVLILIEGIYWV